MMCRPTSDNNISTNTNTNCHSSSRRRTCTCGRRRRPSTVSPSTVSPSITAAEIMSDLANEDDINSCQELRNQTEVQLGTSTKKLKTNIDYYYGPLNDEIDEEGRQPNLSSSTKSRIKNLGTTYAGLPRPDSKGRVGSKECHFFSFCDDLDDEIEFELAQEEANDKDSIYCMYME